MLTVGLITCTASRSKLFDNVSSSAPVLSALLPADAAVAEPGLAVPPTPTPSERSGKAQLVLAVLDSLPAPAMLRVWTAIVRGHLQPGPHRA